MIRSEKELATFERGKRDGFKGKTCDDTKGRIYMAGWEEGVIERIKKENK